MYDDPYWRTKLTFDNLGNVVNSDNELKSILSGLREIVIFNLN